MTNIVHIETLYLELEDLLKVIIIEINFLNVKGTLKRFGQILTLFSAKNIQIQITLF